MNGELCVGDWAPDPGVKINVNSISTFPSDACVDERHVLTRTQLTLRPTSKKPVQVPLVEISAKEAASHATTILSGV